MRSLLFAISLCLIGGVARAEPRPSVEYTLATLGDRQVTQATIAERETAGRVEYFASETRIAERDVYTARLHRAVAMNAWQLAIAGGHPNDAGVWAVRHLRAMTEEHAARRRLLLYRAQRDIARADFRQAVVDLKRALAVKQRVATR